MFKSLGKYSVIIVTTVLFLALVLTVLGLNFYMSFQVEANAESVNVAGRQRMLSQRISKSLLNTQAQLLNNKSIDISLNELKGATSMFDTTLNAFENGGEITGTSGQKSHLSAVSTVQGKNIVSQANTLWKPFHQDILKTIQALDASDNNSASLLAQNTQYARENINSILRLMNDLTNEQEGIASGAANQSRIIQAFGIIAALICFIVIMYRIFGQLRKADAQTEAAQRETQQIFSTVDQGLFLLDGELRMGEQHSQELEHIFSETNISQRRFTHFLNKMVSSSDMDNVKRYMKLLFDPHKKQKLITDLNPLNEVSLQIKNGSIIENKFLRFNFMRVYNGKKIERVLTSVSDITKEVKLAKDLERESKRSEQQLEMVSAMMDADKTLMPIYLDNSDQALNKLNDMLREPARTTEEFKAKARSMMSTVHSVKGESSALSLNIISEICHEFEANLELALDKQIIDGHDFVEPTVLLNRLMSYNASLRSLFNSIFGSQRSDTQNVNESVDWGHLKSYANEVAQRQAKQTNLQISGLDAPNLAPELVASINTISTQLIRNAISHGIETPNERENAKKGKAGLISIALFNNENQGYQYMFHDDGAGINFEKVTQIAINKGILSAEKAKTMSKSQLINMIFSSDLSTADEVDQDKGRGVGMVSILQSIKKLGGKITVKTNPLIGTTFIVNYPKNLGKESLIAA